MMTDPKRAVLLNFRATAKTPDEVELANALLEGYDGGELDVVIDETGGEPLVTLKK